MKYGLAIWTNRVIETKLRELEVAQRYDHKRLRYVHDALGGKPMLSHSSLAFKKWKEIRTRHVEELSLMESYRYVKREGTPWVKTKFPIR